MVISQTLQQQPCHRTLWCGMVISLELFTMLKTITLLLLCIFILILDVGQCFRYDRETERTLCRTQCAALCVDDQVRNTCLILIVIMAFPLFKYRPTRKFNFVMFFLYKFSFSCVNSLFLFCISCWKLIILRVELFDEIRYMYIENEKLESFLNLAKPLRLLSDHKEMYRESVNLVKTC